MNRIRPWRNRTRGLTGCLVWLACLLACTASATAEEDASYGPVERLRLLADDVQWYYLIKGLAFGSLREPTDALLELAPADREPSRYMLGSELRLDLRARREWLALGVKPRLTLDRSWWRDGDRDGDADSDSDLFVNEWQAQIRLRPDLFVSYGRENLQWGPSYLTSPSNPFGSEKGRDTPKRELPGMDYAKAIWMPARNWTLSLLANTGSGRVEFPDYDSEFAEAYARAEEQRDAAYAEVERQIPWDFPAARQARAQARAQIDAAYADGVAQIAEREEALSADFERTYAAKLDLTLDRRYLSLIGSYREGDDPRIGGFASWNAADALVVYGEGSVGVEGSDVELLGGAFYTLLNGATFAAEYFFNQRGDAHAPASELLPPNRALDPRSVFLRRNYLLLQYIQGDIANRYALIGRWTCNLDDQSSRLAGQIDMDINDLSRLFLNAIVDIGGSEDEFGGSLKWMATVGIEVTY